MKHLLETSVWFLAFSLSASAAVADINVQSQERIEALVVEPLQQRSMFLRLSAFSRALVAIETPEMRLWTSAPLRDVEGRAFVAFRLEEADAEESTSPVSFTGCYYPGADAAFIVVEGMDVHVPINQHPLLTMEIPKNLEEGKSLCRASD
jgi:hypothetical protein